MHAAFGGEREAGEQSLLIEQQMQLRRSFGAPVLPFCNVLRKGSVTCGSCEEVGDDLEVCRFCFAWPTGTSF